METQRARPRYDFQPYLEICPRLVPPYVVTPPGTELGGGHPLVSQAPKLSNCALMKLSVPIPAIPGRIRGVRHADDLRTVQVPPSVPPVHAPSGNQPA
jgi:hypothetical protein